MISSSWGVRCSMMLTCRAFQRARFDRTAVVRTVLDELVAYSATSSPALTARRLKFVATSNTSHATEQRRPAMARITVRMASLSFLGKLLVDGSLVSTDASSRRYSLDASAKSRVFQVMSG